MSHEVTSSDAPEYQVPALERDDAIIARALAILEARVMRQTIDSTTRAAEYLRLLYGEEVREVFALMHLDSQRRVIKIEPLFWGTLDGSMVHPREILRAVLDANAGAVILVHNHPSGVPEPSHADVAITKKIQNALATIDVRVVDHIVVAAGGAVSFAERGLL